MFAGTGSDVGKSIIAAAFCRIFKQDGYRPAPYKAQNMALNSYATPEGLEIGRAQAVQAEAAGVPCHTDMNPLLLKPQSDHTSQVVLNGRPIGNRNAYDYFRKEGREELRKEVRAAYDRLARRYNPVVLEGAGSISEINLRDSDLVNLPMALYAGADVILVADIDRGGVFASVYGSVMLLRPNERERIKGILINKFRGDIRLFESGVKMIEELCGIPVVGVVPYYKDIYIEEEDSVALAAKSMQAERGKVNIAVVLLRHLSNFTDFNALERDPRVHLFYTNNTDELAKADIIILPGSKSTLSDLYELRRNGVAQAVVRAHREGTAVLGICGGYQLMGQEVLDPDHVEGDIDRLPGLGLLPVSTRMTGEKVTRQVNFQLLENCRTAVSHGNSHPPTLNFQPPTPNFQLKGYEIHMGETVRDGHVVCALSGGVDSTVVAVLLHKAIGKNLHCIFVDNGVLRSGEGDEVVTYLREHFDLNLKLVNAQDRFLDLLAGVEDPEKKRKIIGHTFIDVFDEEARAIGNVEWLAQGTLYPDVIESVSHKGPSAVIKSHHNVGGLPEKMNMKLIEPLRELFKDEVRQVGAELGMPESVIWRQPFPGPGLAIRVIGEVTRERLDILRKADTIVQQELRDAGWYRKIWQGFAVLLPLKTVGVMGDGRTYEHVIALRCVDSVDAMTADWARLPYDLLERISRRIINEVKGVNRVVYDVSSKPPSTIEWE